MNDVASLTTCSSKHWNVVDVTKRHTQRFLCLYSKDILGDSFLLFIAHWWSLVLRFLCPQRNLDSIVARPICLTFESNMKASEWAWGPFRIVADGGLSKQADKLLRIPLCAWALLRATEGPSSHTCQQRVSWHRGPPSHTSWRPPHLPSVLFLFLHLSLSPLTPSSSWRCVSQDKEISRYFCFEAMLLLWVVLCLTWFVHDFK